MMNMRLLLALPVLLLGLAGCAHGPVKGYEGPEQPASALALLAIPATIDVTSIDGHDASAGLLGPRDRQVQVLAGEHVLTLRYIGVFKGAGSDDDIVRSRPVALRFVAVGGSSYQFRLDPPKDADAGRKFAKDPRFDLVESGSGKVFSSVVVKSYAEASLLDTINKALQNGDNPEPAKTTNLDLLKDIWGRASKDEKTAFKTWLDNGAKP
jgi:uncharacterized protein YccT (UPF0319 family)